MPSKEFFEAADKYYEISFHNEDDRLRGSTIAQYFWRAAIDAAAKVALEHLPIGNGYRVRENIAAEIEKLRGEP